MSHNLAIQTRNDFIAGVSHYEKWYGRAVICGLIVVSVMTMRDQKIIDTSSVENVHLVGFKVLQVSGFMAFLVIAASAMSMWVMVLQGTLLWHMRGGERFGVSYVPGITFMPRAIKIIIGICLLMLWTQTLCFDGVPNPQRSSNADALMMMALLGILLGPVLLSHWIKAKG